MQMPATASGQLKLRRYRLVPLPSARVAIGDDYAVEGSSVLARWDFLRRLRFRTGGLESEGTAERAGAGSGCGVGSSWVTAPFPLGRFTLRIGMLASIASVRSCRSKLTSIRSRSTST